MKTQGVKYDDFYWQDGFAVFSVSQSKSYGLVKHIKNQRQHHDKRSFKEKYRELLILHKMKFDDKYLWD